MHIEEVKPEDFTPERFQPIMDVIMAECGRPGKPEHFYDRWQEWMRLGFARAWAAEGCVLGALFTRDVFSGLLRAGVVFWFSLPAVRRSPVTGRVFAAFEQAARDAGCVDIQSAAHETLSPKARESGYLRHGFRMTETIYTKTL